MDAVATPKTKSTPGNESRKPSLLRVASLKPCEMPLEVAGGVTYRMVYVTMNGKQVVHPCTKAVYNLIVTTKPDFDKKSDFVLTLDPSTDVVTHLTKQPKPDGMLGFKKEAEGVINSKAVILSLYSDGSLAPIHVPERVTENTIEEIMTAVRETTDELTPGIKVGRYVVLERREITGATEIHVDPMAR